MAPEILIKNFKVGCEGCPRGRCPGCSAAGSMSFEVKIGDATKSIYSEGSSLGDSSPIKKVLESSAFTRSSLVIFRPGGIDVRPVSQEKKCSKCGEKSGCPHEKL